MTGRLLLRWSRSGIPLGITLSGANARPLSLQILNGCWKVIDGLAIQMHQGSIGIRDLCTIPEQLVGLGDSFPIKPVASLCTNPMATAGQ